MQGQRVEDLGPKNSRVPPSGVWGAALGPLACPLPGPKE